eukprot:7842443-Pyramimonas_sp.AAC.1
MVPPRCWECGVGSVSPSVPLFVSIVSVVGTASAALAARLPAIVAPTIAPVALPAAPGVPGACRALSPAGLLMAALAPAVGSGVSQVVGA